MRGRGRRRARVAAARTIAPRRRRGGLRLASIGELRPPGLRRTTRRARRSCCSWSSSRARSGCCATGSRSSSRSSTSATGSATAASRGCSRSPSTPSTRSNRRFFVYYTNGDGDIEVDGFKRKRSRRRPEPASGSRRRVIADPAPALRATTTAASCSSAPTGCSTSAPATAATPAIRTTTPRTATRCSASCCGSTRSARRAIGLPKSNPFDGARGRDEIYALGLRNPFRFSFDSRSGDIFIGDVGQDSWEEIDHVSRAASAASNFGWDMLEGNARLRGPQAARPLPARRCSSTRRAAAPARSPAGYVVRDPQLPALAGRYVYADFCRRRDPLASTPPTPSGSDAATGLRRRQPTSFGEGAGGRDLRHLARRRASTGSSRAERGARVWDGRASRGVWSARDAHPPAKGRLRWSPRPSPRRPPRSPTDGAANGKPEAAETLRRPPPGRRLGARDA